MSTDFELAKTILTLDEGDVRYVYDDGTGKRVFAPSGNYLTIGIGHNLDASPLPDCVIDLLFRIDYEKARISCLNIFPDFLLYSTARRLVLLSMCFQLGERGVRSFVNTVAAIRDRDWELAHDHMLNSLWARQVPKRAERLANALKNDVFPGLVVGN